MEEVEKAISDTLLRRENARIYIEGLSAIESPVEKFDIIMWHKLVNYVTVMPNKTMVFHMRDDHDEIVSLEEEL